MWAPLRAHHVADGDDGKVETPRHAGGRIRGSGARGAHAAADHVRTDYEVPLGVDRPPGTDHGFPPSRLLGHRMQVGNMLIAGESVADQHRIAALSIERTVCLVSDLKR